MDRGTRRGGPGTRGEYVADFHEYLVPGTGILLLIAAELSKQTRRIDDELQSCDWIANFWLARYKIFRDWTPN
jgi:hypothetical protein